MLKLRAAIIALFAAMLLAPAHAVAQEAQPQSGYLVYSVGSIDIAMSFRFGYRSIDLAHGADTSARTGEMVCNCVGLWRPRPRDLDYHGREAGRVFVQPLPAGRYEIHNFSFFGTTVVASVDWSSGAPFSIPFTIAPGEATYIGNYARAPSLGTELEPVLGAAGYFVISDQSARDLAIARQRVPHLPQVTTQVFDVSSLNLSTLRSEEARRAGSN